MFYSIKVGAVNPECHSLRSKLLCKILSAKKKKSTLNENVREKRKNVDAIRGWKFQSSNINSKTILSKVTLLARKL